MFTTLGATFLTIGLKLVAARVSVARGELSTFNFGGAEAATVHDPSNNTAIHNTKPLRPPMAASHSDRHILWRAPVQRILVTIFKALLSLTGISFPHSPTYPVC